MSASDDRPATGARRAALRPAVARLGRFATFARSLLTGGAATVADLAVIALAVGVLHLPARAASVPALLAGAVVQFLGSRHFAFRAGAGGVRRQVVLFALTEGVALGLNAALYHVAAGLAPAGVASAVIARALTTNAVFLLWSYPVWRRVFQPAPPGREAREA